MNSLSRIFASLVLVVVFAGNFASCSPERKAESAALASAAPVSPLDGMINAYEKEANEYVRVARKQKAGDVSVTIRYMELGDSTRKSAAKLQLEVPKMNPVQAQRLAAITAKTAVYWEK